MYSKVIDNVSVAQHQSLPSSMEVHLVDKNDIFYRKGRVLAEDIYQTVWNTQSLIDGNDYGIVVQSDGIVVGNMNVQLRSDEKILKSEAFFKEEHWKNYFDGSPSNIAEASALAISSELSSQSSRSVMIVLVLGLLSLCRQKGIRCLVTVQHDYLIRILSKSLHLPFIKNEIVTNPQGQLPDDKYWRRNSSPKIYYLDVNNEQTVNVFASFFSYLNVAGIQTKFIPRIRKVTQPLSYSAFYRTWEVENKMAMAV